MAVAKVKTKTETVKGCDLNQGDFFYDPEDDLCLCTGSGGDSVRLSDGETMSYNEDDECKVVGGGQVVEITI